MSQKQQQMEYLVIIPSSESTHNDIREEEINQALLDFIKDFQRNNNNKNSNSKV